MDTLDLPNPTVKKIKKAMEPITSALFGSQPRPGEPFSTRFLRIPNVPPGVFEALDEVKLGGRLAYDFETNDLVIRIRPSAGHECAHISLMFRIMNKLRAMGAPEDDMCPTGATTFTGDGGNIRKEADSSMCPWPERQRVHAPTLVIEADVFEGAAHLYDDALAWLTCFEPCVNVVILILLDLTARNLRLEAWTRREDKPVIIDLTPINDNDTYQASRDLRLRFEDLMLRPSPREEAEIVFTKEELAGWASFIFRGVDRR